MAYPEEGEPSLALKHKIAGLKGPSPGSLFKKEKTHNLSPALIPPPRFSPKHVSVPVRSTASSMRFRWQLESWLCLTPDSQCRGTEKPKHTFQKGRKPFARILFLSAGPIVTIQLPPPRAQMV